jgi:hypothetical protein
MLIELSWLTYVSLLFVLFVYVGKHEYFQLNSEGSANAALRLKAVPDRICVCRF